MDQEDAKLCVNCGWWEGDRAGPIGFCDLASHWVSPTGVCDCHVEAQPFA